MTTVADALLVGRGDNSSLKSRLQMKKGQKHVNPGRKELKVVKTAPYSVGKSPFTSRNRQNVTRGFGG